MKIRTIIVEDEPLARDRLRALLAGNSEIEIIAECSDGAEAVKKILELSPDLIFLDVQLPEFDGFQVLAAISQETMPVVIFVTAYDKFALQAFEVHAIDYLLKPFDRERLQRAVQRAKDQLAQSPAPQTRDKLLELLDELRPEAKYPKRLAIKATGRVTFVKTAEIDWIEAADNYVNIHVGAAVHLIRETLTSLERRLSPEEFVRISRSCIINLERVKEMQPLFHGEYAITLSNGTRVTLSRSYRENLQRLMGEVE